MNGGGGDGDYRYDDLDALLRLGLPQTMQQSPNHRTHNNGTSQNAQPPNYGGPSSRHGYDPAGGAASSSSLPASSAYPSTVTYLPPPPQFVGGISTTVGMHSTSIPTHLMNLHRPLTTNPNKTVPTPSSFSNLPGSHSQILSQTGITTSFSSLPMNAYSSHTFFKQDESYLDRMSIPVSAISLEPLSGVDVVRRVETKAQHVMTRYLPCVTFLVQCQQDLRDGLESGSMTNRTGYSRGRRATLTPRQYYAKCLHSLPDKFHRSNSRIMEAKELSIAVQEIHALCQNAKRVEYQGCEVMKNTFLGGIKDGESWGLRKWLSKHGGALHICNDIESILNACQKLNRDEESTKKLSAKLRPVAQYALDRLKKGVPDSYQKVSSAHPYLPFFHRLESALKNMATFDPDDDDVICIDDEDELEEAKASAKRKQQANAVSDNTCRPAEKKSRVERDVVAPFADSRPNAGDGGDNDIEVWDEKPAARPSRPLPQQLPPTHPAQSEEWRCPCCHMLNPATADTHCILCNGSYSQGPVGALPADPGGGGPLEDDDDSFRRAMEDFANLEDVDWPDISRQTSEHSSRVDASLSQQQQQPSVEKMSANDMADRLDHLAYVFESNQESAVRPTWLLYDSFWDTRFANVLRLFASILRQCDAGRFLERVDEHEPQRIVIRYPISFQDIVTALLGDSRVLPNSSRVSYGHGHGLLNYIDLDDLWNMWKGRELVEAIDLVLVNSLAFHGKEKTRGRSHTNQLRHLLWAGVEQIASGATADVRSDYPTRRGETSSMVLAVKRHFA